MLALPRSGPPRNGAVCHTRAAVVTTTEFACRFASGWRGTHRNGSQRTIQSWVELGLGLATRVATGRLKDRAKIERVLGRLQASYASVADLYEMAVREDAGHLRLHWRLIEDRRAWRDARDGAYLLRTNLVGQTVEELWTKYMQLTEAEAAFRALKSELAIRPCSISWSGA